ncbi:MAG: hypothetical protein LBS95_00455 [Mycoplasmataceae bacterium]|jgi:hypothetical protein|nr:hypothetical protein [Mycoplasmataceae bacterium]
MKNNKTFKFLGTESKELERIKLDPTVKADLSTLNDNDEIGFDNLSKEELKYKLEFENNLSKKQKKRIKEILKNH